MSAVAFSGRFDGLVGAARETVHVPVYKPWPTYSQVRDKRPSPILTLFGTIALAIVSYFVAVFTFAVLARISQLPRGSLWDEGGFRAPLLFVLMAVVVGFMIVPYFQKDRDAGVRTFSLFCTTFLIAYAIFHGTRLVDPDVPLDAFVYYVIDPLRRMLHF